MDGALASGPHPDSGYRSLGIWVLNLFDTSFSVKWDIIKCRLYTTVVKMPRDVTCVCVNMRIVYLYASMLRLEINVLCLYLLFFFFFFF